MPTILVIDPITGQKMRAWEGMVSAERLLEVHLYLIYHSLFYLDGFLSSACYGNLHIEPANKEVLKQDLVRYMDMGPLEKQPNVFPPQKRPREAAKDYSPPRGNFSLFLISFCSLDISPA